MFTDPISDMLTRIRNASAVKKSEVIIPFSKIKWEISNVFLQEGFIEGVSREKGTFETIKIQLKYQNNLPVINKLKRISTASQRVYVNKDHLVSVRNGLGISILSTSQGIMTNKEARKRKIGGELICEVY